VLGNFGIDKQFSQSFQLSQSPFLSAPIKRLDPTTSAARIAVNRRSRCSLLKMHRLGAGKLNAYIAELCADVRLCPCPLGVIRVDLARPRRLPVYSGERTFSGQTGMSQKCHQPKSALVTLRSVSPSNSDIARCCRRSTSSAARSDPKH
jgi:hypothetical protein